MPREIDVAVVGSGHNGLIAAAYLARAGWSVEVFERNSEVGGAVATEELTLPGYRHDTFSSWHSQFHLSAAFEELGAELGERGLEYVVADHTTATAWGDGNAVCAYRDPVTTAAGFVGADESAYLAELDRFAKHADLIGELLGTELYSRRAPLLALRLARRLRVRHGVAFAHDVMSSARDWLTSRFESDLPRTLYAPWVLHLGLSPEGAGGGFQLLALASGLHQVGMPVVRGGSVNFVRALVRLIEDHGGTVHAGTEVEQIQVQGGRAAGVVMNGEQIHVRKAVIANVTPTQLYGRLLLDGVAPPQAAEQARLFRYSRRGNMQIHLALDEPLRWSDERLAKAATIHVTGGLNAVGIACAQADAGLLPVEPTIMCGQPTAVDPTRAPEGKAVLWIQLLETPYAPRGDAAGKIDVGDGVWTESLEDAYAARVVELIGRHTTNLPGAIVGQNVISPAELERRNPNLVHGDPYAGANRPGPELPLASAPFLWVTQDSHRRAVSVRCQHLSWAGGSTAPRVASWRDTCWGGR